MRTSPDFDLVLYGAMLSILGVVAHRLAPDCGSGTLIVSVAGGVASIFWGVLGLGGFRQRLWPITTLIVVEIALLVQSVKAWLQVESGNEAFKRAALILTLLFVFGLGQLVNSVQAHRSNR